MRIFLTGATGFIGSRIVPELVGAGHDVIGVTRSDAGARRLAAQGAEPFCGTLEEPDGLARGADAADAVIHCAFDHDFSRFVENCDKDRRVIEAIGGALAGSDRPMLVTSGVGFGIAHPGAIAREDVSNYAHPNPRAASERAVDALAERGVRVAAVRLPQVHDTARQGLITVFIAHARQTGAVCYLGEGLNRWSAAHVSDVARLYRLAIEQAAPGARLNAVAEEGVTARAVAEVLGERLALPVRAVAPDEADAVFGGLAMFASMDLPASGAATQARFEWQPAGLDLLTDLRALDDAG